MTQTTSAAALFASVLLGAAPALAASVETIRVLVTNDDGVAAPGIDALVAALAANPNLVLTVVAPATNQSGTGDNKKTAPKVDAQMQEGSSVGVRGTPGFIINGRLVSGAQPFENFKNIIDDELASSK